MKSCDYLYKYHFKITNFKLKRCNYLNWKIVIIHRYHFKITIFKLKRYDYSDKSLKVYNSLCSCLSQIKIFTNQIKWRKQKLYAITWSRRYNGNTASSLEINSACAWSFADMRDVWCEEETHKARATVITREVVVSLSVFIYVPCASSNRLS